MNISELNAISPVDGRYRNKTNALSQYFSEEALIKYRVLVEVEYFISLCQIPLPQLKNFDNSIFDDLRSIYQDFSSDDAKSIKAIENITNHDVKAVEYFLKEKFDALNLTTFKEFIHFGLTSQDINNTAVPLSIKEAILEVYNSEYENIFNSWTTCFTYKTWKRNQCFCREITGAVSCVKTDSKRSKIWWCNW